MDKYTSKQVTITAEEYKSEAQAPDLALVDKKHKEMTKECVVQKGHTSKGKYRPLTTAQGWFDRKSLKAFTEKNSENFNKKLEMVAMVDLPSGRKFIEKGDMLVFAKDEDKEDVLVDVIAQSDFKLKFESVKAVKDK